MDGYTMLTSKSERILPYPTKTRTIDRSSAIDKIKATATPSMMKTENYGNEKGETNTYAIDPLRKIMVR
jgi:hypothetical protein